MNRGTWRAWLAAPIASLAFIIAVLVAIAATPPTAAAIAPANTPTTIELVVVQQNQLAVNVNATAVADLKLQKVSFRVAWHDNDVGWATMPQPALPAPARSPDMPIPTTLRLDSDVGWHRTIHVENADTHIRSERFTMRSDGRRSVAPQFTVRMLVNRDPHRPVAVVDRYA